MALNPLSANLIDAHCYILSVQHCFFLFSSFVPQWHYPDLYIYCQIKKRYREYYIQISGLLYMYILYNNMNSKIVHI